MIGTFTDMTVVLEAGNGLELIQKLETTTADILMLDLQMPVMDGFETSSKIKKLYPDIKILILTLMDEIESIRKCITMGVNGYFTKNTAPAELENAIWKLQDSGFYFEKNLSTVINEIRSNKNLKFEQNKEIIFTIREQEILALTAMGIKAKEIAEKLFISTKTVNAHKQNIQQKYGFETMLSAILYGISNGIIELDKLEK